MDTVGVVAKRRNPKNMATHDNSNNENRPSRTNSKKDDYFEFTAPCPICKKRTLDISDIPETLIQIRHKCPHCKKLVITPVIVIGMNGQMTMGASS
jgi:hypothetical protein